MFVLRAEALQKDWNGERIFENVNLEIRTGDRIALFGANGAGKTTLFKMLMGVVKPDGGRLSRHLPLSEWGWMEQSLQVPSEMTALEFVQAGTSELHQLKKRLDTLQMQMEQGASDEMEAAVELYGDAYQQYLTLEGYEWEVRVEKCMTQLGMPAETWSTPFLQLSGGQKTRAQLARLLVRRPSMLLLDEPTNHLDQESMQWLEEWIRDYDGTVLLVSHDRSFLDQTVDTIWELTPAGVKVYKGGYSDFKEQRELEVRTQEATYQKQQREKQALMEQINHYQQWFQQAHNSAGERNPFLKKKANKNMTRFRAKEKALERLEKQEVDRPKEGAKISVQFQDGAFEARTLLQMEGVSFGYDEQPLFRDVHLTLGRGDRLAVIGPNGAGKTTLLKVMIGELEPSQGHVTCNPQLKVGYFAQELTKLDREATILDSLLDVPGMTQARARTILACFLFRQEDVFKKIGNLSMGERCRVAFVRLYFSDANLLVLDEPTNYLDIDTRERIEEALCSYPGALVLVSHDRYLLKQAATRVALVQGGEVRQFHEPYTEYLDRLQERRGEPEDLHAANELRQLELQLSLCMSREEPEAPEEREELMRTIRELGARIRKLKGESL